MGLVFKLFSAPHAKQPGAVNAPNPPFLFGGKKEDILLYFLFCFVLTYGPSFALLRWGLSTFGGGMWFWEKGNGEKVRGTCQTRTGTKRSTGPKQCRIRIACVCLVRAHQYKYGV